MRKTMLYLAVLLSLLVIGREVSAFGLFQNKMPSGSGTVTGEVIIKGVGPMLDGTVFFIDEANGIPPSATKYWLVPSRVFKVDSNAKFTAVLPEGTYYMGIIERNSDEVLGPPEEGDLFFISQDKKGNPKKLTVWEKATINLGTISDAALFKQASLAKKGITSIQGTLRDVHGNPIQGMMVAAYVTSEILEKPLFVSARSDSDGKYDLRVNKGGKYYLMTRANYGGGPPSSDEFIGFYKDGKPVTIKTGATRKGIDILVWPYAMYEE